MNTLIVSGGNIDLNFLQNYYSNNTNQTIIAVDKGLEALYKLRILPNHIVGDFDSIYIKTLEYYTNNPNIQIHKYIPEKDYTDTDIALNLAINLRSSNITIIGATGSRIDHTLANIHILTSTLKANIPCQIIDSNNKIYLINNSLTLEKSKTYGKYISLIPLTSSIYGLTLKGFKYPLEKATLTIGKSLGISNEIIQDIATINLKEGILIVIESKDS
ncbi:MAG: thiamine diphosphokinase [Clostridia bacterium]|nr:thiamine diphosphokinase [Clostridia bacterium]